jgi:hypothetical protein
VLSQGSSLFYSNTPTDATVPGLQFSEKKIIPQNTEQTEILIHFVGIPSVSQNGNARDSVPSHSAEDKKARNSVPNHFVEDKNTRNFVISLQIIQRRIKLFQTIS